MPSTRDQAMMAEAVDRLSAATDHRARGRARRAALRDAVRLADWRTGEYLSNYHGPIRPDYRAFLAGYMETLGGRLEDGPDGLVAVFVERQIRVRPAPSTDHADAANGNVVQFDGEAFDRRREGDLRQDANAALRAGQDERRARS